MFLKRKVFNLFLNSSVLFSRRRSLGKAFHSFGPHTDIARLPITPSYVLTTSFLVRSLCTKRNISVNSAGAAWFTDLRTEQNLVHNLFSDSQPVKLLKDVVHMHVIKPVHFHN